MSDRIINAQTIATPHLEFHGTASLILHDPGTIITDRFALITGNCVYKIKRQNWQQIPDVGTLSKHPIFDFISMTHRELSFDGPFAVARCTFEGINAPAGEFTAPVYELIEGVSEDDISTHPKFNTKDIGGTAKDPQNGAVFERLTDGHRVEKKGDTDTNAGYVFREFSIFVGATDTLNPYRKGETYLNASQMTWRKTFNGHSYNTVDITKAGKIDTPDGGAPPLANPRNWLNMGFTSTQRGSARTFTVEWRASGPNGWSDKIYK